MADRSLPRRVAAAAASLAALCSAAAALAVPPLLTPDGTLAAGWRYAGLPDQKPPATRFSAERVDGRDALRLEAERSYGNWVHPLDTPTPGKTLSWSWRLDVPNPRGNLARKDADDLAARVCLSFDLPLAQLPFLERQKLQLARSIAGMDIPTQTLCWVWGGPEATGRVVANAYTARVRQIVLRNAGDAVGRWFDEVRDVRADYRRAFGDEADEPPPVRAVLIGADADNTLARSVAHVAGVQLR